MYFDFCIGKPDLSRTPYPIDTIFYLCGDETYRTPRKEITQGKTYFVCTTRGTGTLQMDGHRLELTEGTSIFLQPTEQFGYATKNDCWHFWWFEFMGSPAPFAPNTTLQTSISDFKIDLFSQSLSYAQEGRWDIASLLFESACKILQHTTYTKAQPLHTAQWQTITRYIRDNLQTVTVARICEAMQINERTLRNLFYANCGKAPKQFIIQSRLRLGCQLLEGTVLPIAEISTRLGFSSQFHFSRAFKERYGKAPLVWRIDSRSL